MTNQQQKANRLLKEKSPYLVQHAYNPVDWYPWGEEAFARAKSEDKPIFLSIGYSACHWCHVMAHETFEDAATAEILNKYFISVKVDREERPDIDSIYMTACQAYNGSGGWPLSVFINFEKKPFFAGTYFPTESFKLLLQNILNLWDTRRHILDAQSAQITAILNRKKSPGNTPLQNISEKAYRYLNNSFDSEYGGFSGAPKFPSPQNLLFLLEYNRIKRDSNSLYMCEKTLKSMHSGGIYDHIGGGFSRYSTDDKWLVPHFEKMLYDNSLLLLIFAKCYESTHDKFYSNVAKEIAAYLIRDMLDCGGAFYTAEDADSEGHEGLFYTFNYEEIKNILGDTAGEFCRFFNVTKEGNFEGRNILNTIKNKSLPKTDYPDNIINGIEKLFDYRSKRVRPHRDEKIMTSYNGLCIAAFAVAGRIFDDANLISIAEMSSDFIEKNLTSQDGALLSFYKDSPSEYGGFAEDYAFYIWGLLELFNAVTEEKYLTRATALQEIFTREFYDEDNGGFFLYGSRGEKLISRPKELYDGAIPSYNSVALHNLHALYKLTSDSKYMEQLVKTLSFFSGDIAKYPEGYIHSVSAIMILENELPHIQICTGNACRPPAKNLEEFIGYF